MSRGTVTAVLSRRDPRGDRIAVQWDGSIAGELWARSSDRVAVGDRVEATREGTPLVLRWTVVTTPARRWACEAAGLCPDCEDTGRRQCPACRGRRESWGGPCDCEDGSVPCGCSHG